MTAEDPLGNTTATTYNALGWPLTVTSPQGVATTGVPHDFETTYEYDLGNRTTTVTGPEGDVSVTELDASGNTVSDATGITVGNPTGDVTTYAYTDAGQLEEVDPPGSGARTYRYRADGLQDRFTNESGAVYEYAYDNVGRLTSETDPNSRTTTYSYDSAGLLATIKQPVSGASCTGTKVGCVTYSYDAAGRPTSIDYSSTGTSDVTAITYDALGRRTAATTSGVKEEWTWNRRTQMTSSKDANGRTTSYGWDKVGNLTTIRYPGQTVDAVRTFDDAGRLDSVTDWDGRTVTFGYDADSNWTETAFPGTSGAANTDQYAYDDAGRMTSVTWRQGDGTGTVLGSETYTRPNATKGMVEGTTPTGSAGTTAKTNTYDPRDRLTAAGTEAFDYDAASNLVETGDGRLQVFDPAQQLCWSSATAASGSCSTPSSDATTYTYDDLGNRTRQVDADGAGHRLSYDQANRLTTIDSPAPVDEMDGTPLTGDFDGDGIDDTLFYRAGGASDDWIWWGTGDRTTLSHETGRVNVTGTYLAKVGDFNCDGRDDIFWYLSGGTANDDSVWFWDTRTGTGRYTTKAFSQTGSFTPRTGDFDGDSCDDILWFAPGATADAIWWGDTDVADPGTTFDIASASISYSGPVPTVGDYNGDGHDDIFWYGPGADPDSVWTYNSSRVVTTTALSTTWVGASAFAGDFNGDGYDDILLYRSSNTDAIWWGSSTLSSLGSSTKTVTLNSGYFPVPGNFDNDGKDDLYLLRQTSTGDTVWWGASTTDFGTAAGSIGIAGPEATYRYDVAGFRAGKSVLNNTTQFTWSRGAGLPMLLDERTGSDVTSLIYGPSGQPVEQINPDGSVAWLHRDQLGSIRLTTDASAGGVDAAAVFDAYGSVLSSSGDLPLLGYAGQYQDGETGLHYLRARYYDAETGQFLTVDPARRSTAEPYGYAGSNPASNADSSGFNKCEVGANPFRWPGNAGDCASDVTAGGIEGAGELVSEMIQTIQGEDDSASDTDAGDNNQYCSRAGHLDGCISASFWAMWAHRKTDGRENANQLRHCYWSALMTWDIGERKARGFLQRHEGGTNLNDDDEVKDSKNDAHNNQVGINIGNRNSATNMISAANTTMTECRCALNDGRLK